MKTFGADPRAARSGAFGRAVALASPAGAAGSGVPDRDGQSREASTSVRPEPPATSSRDSGGGLPNNTWTTRAFDAALADRIRDYWRERGAKVTTSVETIRSKSTVFYTIRSDMRGGLPTGSGAVFRPSSKAPVRRGGAVQTIQARAEANRAQIIAALGRRGAPASAAEIARETGLSYQNTYQHLLRLVEARRVAALPAAFHGARKFRLPERRDG